MRLQRLFHYSFLILFLFVFNSCGTESTPIYNLTTSVNGEGTITPSSGEFEEGETITLTSEPSEGWVFHEWSGDGSGSSNSVTITMDSDKNVVGNFQRREYPLTITVEGEGTVKEQVISSFKTTEYPFETVIELTSKPDDGWVFYQWRGDLVGSSNPETIEISEEKEVTSVFKSIDELLTIEIIGEGTIEIQQESFEDSPSRRTITLTPDPSSGWVFVEWDGDLAGNEIPKNINLTNKINVTVKFTESVFLGDNGVTIMCPYGEVGDIGLVNGVEYEIVDRELLLQRIEEGTGSLNRNVCVSLITDMKDLFRGLNFNGTIGDWDVSNVTNMSMTFFDTVFDQPIGDWDVSSVKDMSHMFSGSTFNQDISDWNVNNVTNMSHIFYKGRFDQPIGSWDVSNVTNMSTMFVDTEFDQPIGDWDVSNVTDMSRMFESTTFNQDIGNWDVSNVTNMTRMFFGSVFDQLIGKWDVSNVTDMSYMFIGTTFNQDISDWNVNNVTDMSHMFRGSTFNQDIGSWDVSNVESMSRMFRNSKFNQMIGDWDVSSVTNMTDMFYFSEFNQNISNWCVWRIETEPNGFSIGSPLTEENKPVWGTCPD